MECKVITKGADFSKREENLVLHNNPLKILYAGNLALGRAETISNITKALEKSIVTAKRRNSGYIRRLR